MYRSGRPHGEKRVRLWTQKDRVLGKQIAALKSNSQTPRGLASGTECLWQSGATNHSNRWD